MKYQPTRKSFYWLFFLILHNFKFQRKRKNLSATFAGGCILVFGNTTNAKNAKSFLSVSLASVQEDIVIDTEWICLERIIKVSNSFLYLQIRLLGREMMISNWRVEVGRYYSFNTERQIKTEKAKRDRMNRESDR